MSRRQNGGPIHWPQWTENGRAWTACGRVVPLDATTRDCVDVTCESRGCKAAADHAFELRKLAKAVTW